MVLDALGVAAVRDELCAFILNSRVQEVLQPHRLAVSLELFAGRRWYLTLSADPGEEGLAFGPTRPRRGQGADSPLCLALRSRSVGARLEHVEQPPLERVLVFTFSSPEPIRLVAELTGRLANVVLVDAAGVVVAAARSVTPEMTRARVVLPGRPYQPPPPVDKADPRAVRPESVAAWIAEAPGIEPWQLLVRHVAGLSPLSAREVLARADRAAPGEPPGSPAGSAEVCRALADLAAPLETHAWSPSVAHSRDKVLAYAPYRITQELRPEGNVRVDVVPSMAEAIRSYEVGSGPADPYRHARGAVARDLAQARDRVERRMRSLEREQWDEAAIEELRAAGDLILANQSRIRRGDKTLEAVDPETGARRWIALEPSLPAVDNAQAYYHRYRSRRRAAEAFHERMTAARAERATLDQWVVDLELAEDRPGIDAVHEALIEGGYVSRGRRHPTPPSRPLEVYSSDGFRVLVGRDSRQNERVTFGRAARGDLWLHARDVPGGHVVVKAAGRAVPEATLEEAAAIAAHYSGARHDAHVPVVATDIRHVRRLRGGGPGMVTYDHERVLVATPRSPADLGLA